MASRAPLLWPDQVDESACVSLRDGRGQADIRGLVTAGRAVRQERFCWSNNVERGFGGVNPVAAHSQHAGHSSRSHLLVFLVRLLRGWAGETWLAAGVAGVKEGCSLIRAISVGAWEESTWSTRSAASMNDVDAEEHRQRLGRAGTAMAG